MGGGDLTGVIGEVTHVAHRGLHPEVLRQEAPDGAGLGGTLDDDQRVGHGQVVNRFLLYRIGGRDDEGW